MSERVFYDSHVTPLSEHEIYGLTAAECQAAAEQLDNRLISVLQDIDENFVRATRIITERILPALEQYGEASRDIWQSVKFWQTFFEAAAGIRFTEPLGEGTGEGDASDVSRDVTLRPESSPRLEATQGPVFSNELSDLDLLQEQIKQQFGHVAPSPLPTAAVDVTGEGDLLQPELETLSLGDLPGTRKPGLEKGKGKASPRKRDNMLQNVLLKNTSTPARLKQASIAVPDEATDRAWTGFTDLSKTPLAALSPAQKPPATRETNDSFDIEPPVLHHFSLPRSRAALARTPAKEAAKLVARDALEAAALKGAGEVDSPLIEPPSVLRNWATRGYGEGSAPPTARKEAASPSARAKGKAALVTGDEDELDDVFNDSLEEEAPPWEEESVFGDEGASVSFAARHGLDEDDAGLEDTVELVDEDAFFPPDNDTLFGGRRATLMAQQATQRQSADFLRGQRVEETFHGGKLENAAPARSPLQGRDPKSGL